MTVSASTIIRSIWSLVFAFGMGTCVWNHAVSGLRPFDWVPLPLEIYWTGLIVLDPLVIALLWLRPRAGVALAVAVMISDVAVNSYVAYVIYQLGPDIWLQLQSLFLGFVLGSAALAWRRR